MSSIKELCGRSGHRLVMLSTDELKLKYGNIVRKEHKVALNQLTKIMNRDQTNADVTGPTFTGHMDILNLPIRYVTTIPASVTCRGHCCCNRPRQRALNGADCFARHALAQ